MALRVLILGGTAEGRLLGERLSEDTRYDPLISFAGRTMSIERPKQPHRIGGFGGAEGLATFLREGRFEALVDATHPFAARISAHAVEAANATGMPLTRLSRPPWPRVTGDNWIVVPDMRAAALAIGEVPRRVFLTIGRLEVEAFCLAPEHDYLVRSVDSFTLPAPLSMARVIVARGPFDFEREKALLEQERAEIVVSKNSGTPATYAKIEAARALAIPVIMVGRPVLPAATLAGDIEDVLRWLESLLSSTGPPESTR
jgi:precorrin-6A/cobalt-precorrin-6A reductase